MPLTPTEQIDAGLPVVTTPDLAARIKAARKRAGLTQVQLAERLEMAQASVSYWERAEDLDRLGLPTLAKIADRCGITLRDLLFGDLEQLPETETR